MSKRIYFTGDMLTKSYSNTFHNGTVAGMVRLSQKVDRLIECAMFCINKAGCRNFGYISTSRLCHVIGPGAGCETYEASPGWKIYSYSMVY